MTNTGSQVWFITGSSRGLGRALVDAAMAAGHRVVATARRPSNLDDVVKRYGERVRAAALDVTDPEQAVGVRCREPSRPSGASPWPLTTPATRTPIRPKICRSTTE